MSYVQTTQRFRTQSDGNLTISTTGERAYVDAQCRVHVERFGELGWELIGQTPLTPVSRIRSGWRIPTWFAPLFYGILIGIVLQTLLWGFLFAGRV